MEGMPSVRFVINLFFITAAFILGMGAGELKASSSVSAQACVKKKALVIEGQLPTIRIGFGATLNEMISDFSRRGYEVDFLKEPSAVDVREYFANEECLKAFGFVGEGVEEDSQTPDPYDSGADFLFTRGGRSADGFAARDMADWSKGKKLDLVVLHACNQGSPNNALRWRSSFHLAGNGFFKGWDYNVKAFETYFWQRSWK